MKYTDRDMSPDILCQVIFGLKFPPIEEELKSEFKSRTMNGEFRHPDRGGLHDKFIQLKDAYEIVLPYCNINSKKVFESRTKQGFLISDLGKGLGPTQNGIECTTCVGEGYFSITGLKTVDRGGLRRCIECAGMGYGFRFAGSNLNLETVICTSCHGSGVAGLVREEITELTRCSSCKGLGELPISNPVLQRGAFSIGTKSHNPKKAKKVKVPNPLFKYKETV